MKFSDIFHQLCCYQRVMNISNTLNNLEINVVDAVHDFLARVPNIEVSSVERELTLRPDYCIDARIGFAMQVLATHSLSKQRRTVLLALYVPQSITSRAT